MQLYKPQPNVFNPQVNMTPMAKPPVAPTASPPVPSPPPAPTNISATGESIGSSPFGNMRIPDIPPEYAAGIAERLGEYTYSIPAGGYLTNEEAQNANSWYNKFGQGSGGNPAANQAMQSLYGYIGSFPTKGGASPALTTLQSRTGAPVRQYPSYNEILGREYGGPWAYPGWDVKGTFPDLYKKKGY